MQPSTVDTPSADEKKETRVLLEQGTVFRFPSRSLLRTIWPTRKLVIRQPYLGTLDYISGISVTIPFVVDELKADMVGEGKRMAHQHTRKASKLVAIAVLNNGLLIRLGSGLLAWYLRWHLTPQKLYELLLVIEEMQNLAGFIHSIRLIAAKRTTTPVLIGNPALPDSEAPTDSEDRF